jgi:hypothetical protein
MVAGRTLADERDDLTQPTVAAAERGACDDVGSLGHNADLPAESDQGTKSQRRCPSVASFAMTRGTRGYGAHNSQAFG